MHSALEEVEGQPSITREQLAGYRIATESYGVLTPKQRGYFFPDDVGRPHPLEPPANCRVTAAYEASFRQNL